jgi:hypothetical protein
MIQMLMIVKPVFILQLNSLFECNWSAPSGCCSCYHVNMRIHHTAFMTGSQRLYVSLIGS